MSKTTTFLERLGLGSASHGGGGTVTGRNAGTWPGAA